MSVQPTTLQRLLRHPHAAVFDKAPGAELVLRIRHEEGSTWSIADASLTATAAGQPPRTYDLSALSVGQLANALRADGFDVQPGAPEFELLSAMVLVEGRGDQDTSNGDHVHGFTSLLWAIMTAYGAEIREAEYQVQQALRQMVITQAEGEWLDLWGTLYGVQREAAEADADYAPRIPEEAFRLRVNAFAIEDAVFAKTGYRITIEEPWKQLMRTSVSPLSEDHYLYDGERWGYHLIRPVATGYVDWAQVLPVIQRNKAAGVIVIGPRADEPARALSFGVRVNCASFSRTDTRGSYAIGDPGGLLSVNMELSNYTIRQNYGVWSAQLRSTKNAVGVKIEQVIMAESMARASMRLSDGYALGDRNARFSGNFTRMAPDASEALSGGENEDGYLISDFAYYEDNHFIDFVEDDLSARFLRFTNERRAGSSQAKTLRASAYVTRTVRYRWTGQWDSRRWTNARKFGVAITSTERPG